MGNPEKHYLEAELEELMRRPETVAFLDTGALDGLWYWDLEKPDHEYMSPGFWRALGYDPSKRSHLASEWQDLIYPEDRDLALINVQRHLADPAHPYDQNVRYRTEGGGTVTVRCRGVAIREGGVPKRMLGVHTVLHDTRAASEQEQIAQLTRTVAGAVLSWSKAGGIRRWEAGSEALYGWTEAQAVGRDVHVLTSAAYPDGWRAVEDALAVRGEWSGEVERRGADGDPRVTLTTIRPIGRGADTVYVQLDQDMTAARQAELELAQANLTLNAVLEALPVAVVIADANGAVLRENAANLALWGKAPTTGSIDEYGLWKGWWPDTGERIAPRDWGMARAIERGEHVKNELSEIERFDDGEHRFILNNAAPIRNADGEITGGVVAQLDATDLQKTEQRLRLLNRELNHRVKNLFAVIQGIIAMTSRAGDDPQAMIATIQDRVQALAAAHTVCMEDEQLEPVPLRDLLDAVLAPYALSDAQVRIEGPKLWLPRSAVTPLGLIVHELATNAVKHGAWSHDGGRVTIRWTLEEAGAVLDWQEACAAPCGGPARGTGLGTSVLRSSAMQLGGTLDARRHEYGLDTRLAFPVERDADGKHG